MDNRFPDEVLHLDMVSRRLEEALREARAMVERLDRDYNEEKRYMSQYRGEIDPHEMFQNELALRQTDGSGAFAVSVRDKLEKLRGSPYFARVDFLAHDSPQADRCYIGRFAFRHQGELLICDWRSPAASLFYDWEVGPAAYDAPMGRVEGELKRKRQFSIRDGVMEYALETSHTIQDDVLQRELSHTSDEKMKSIIATIQREQDQIIRSEAPGDLIIQGAAGSGKTSIALHRVAYLLYRFQDRLAARNVMILSPNRVFGDYISNVLPELGEEPICQFSFADIAAVQLEGVIGFQPDRDPLEVRDPAWAERVRFKSTAEFLGLLDGFIAGLPELVFAPAACAWGEYSATAEALMDRFRAYGSHPVKGRLRLMAQDLHAKWKADPWLDGTVPRPAAILKALNGMLRFKTTLALYQAFCRRLGRPGLLVLPEKRTLEWADVAPFLHLHAAFEGLGESGVIRHLLVDEMQDYTPVQFAVLNRLFSCQKTILGDFGQSVHPYHQSTLEDLRGLYPGGTFLRLRKSYRSTWEIIDFARQIQPAADPEPVARHGAAPRLFPCASEEARAAKLGDLIRAFRESGFASLGILVKTNREAEALYERLGRDHQVHLLTPDSGRFENGVSVSSIQMSKGLEFDQVVVADADRAHYAGGHDRGLLYVACTRAMHQLDLTWVGELTELAP